MRHKNNRITEESHGKLHEYSHQAAEKARHVGEYVKDRTSEIGHHLHERAQRSRDWFDDSLDEYPLAVGAAFFALGLVGGLALPISKSERRWLGPARDRLFNRAHAIGGELLDKGEEVAERMVDTVKGAVGTSRHPARRARSKRRS